jgi:iron-sulfur cluster repair protein YtfE (RIC family)
MAVTGHTQDNDNKSLASQNPGGTPRFDIYGRIHKALRAFMADTLVRMGRADTHDEADLRAALAQLHALLDACEAHLGKENDYVHPAMEARAPGSAGRIAHEHVEHVAAIDNLRAMANRLATLPLPARGEFARGLYQRLALFVAENYEHMHVEETEHNAVLWAHYTDAELLAIEEGIVASLPPETMDLVARWMLPNINVAERAWMLCGMRGNVPPEVFAGMLALCRNLLPLPDWMKLARTLGLPPGAPLAEAA